MMPNLSIITTMLLQCDTDILLLEQLCKNNFSETFVDSIVVFGEGSQEIDIHNLQSHYPDLILHRINSRPDFNVLLNEAMLLNSELIAISNADIWFHAEPSAIKSLHDLLLSRLCPLAATLTRRADNHHGQLLSVDGIKPDFLSSDAWIFSRAHLPEKCFDGIQLGQKGLENLINKRLSHQGFKLFNACNFIQGLRLLPEEKDHSIDNFGCSWDILKSSLSSIHELNEPLSVFPIHQYGAMSLVQSGSEMDKQIPWRVTELPVIIDLSALPPEESLEIILCLAAIVYTQNRVFFLYLGEESYDIVIQLSEFIGNFLTNICPIKCGCNMMKYREKTSYIFLNHFSMLGPTLLDSRLPIYVKHTPFNYLNSPVNWEWNQTCDIERKINEFLRLLKHHGFTHFSTLQEARKKFTQKNCWLPKCQLITCLFKSEQFLSGYMDNCTKLFQCTSGGFHHTFIVTAPTQKELEHLSTYGSNIPFSALFLMEDPGLYECWNLALRLGKEPYAGNANPDDRKHPEQVNKLICLLEANPDNLLASSGVIPLDDSNLDLDFTVTAAAADCVWYGDQPEVYGMESLFSRELDSLEVLQPHNIPHCSPIWKRSIHKKYGYFDEVSYGSEADWALWCKYARDGGKINHCPEALTGYYINDDSYGRKYETPIARYRIVNDLLVSDEMAQNVARLTSSALVEKKTILCTNELPSPDPKVNIIGVDYHYGNHRHSNNNILRSIIDLHSNDAEIDFIWFIERYFLWGDAPGEKRSSDHRALTKPWVGVLHVPPLTPKWAGNQFADIYFSPIWRESLKHCKCLILLSEYMKHDMSLMYPNLNIRSIKHPMPSLSRCFNAEKFLQNKKILLSGYWLRRINDFVKMKTNIDKILLIKDLTESFIQMEQSHRGYYDLSSVQLINYLPDEQYDALLTSSIVYLSLYETSANNALLECIQTNTPCIVNRHPAIEEYLGKDYPLYIEDFSQLNDDYLIERALSAHEYLKLNDKIKKDISMDSFKTSFYNIMLDIMNMN